MTRSLRRLVAVGFPIVLTLAGTAAPASASAVSAKTVSHWATFQGFVSSDGRSGTAGDNVGTPSVEGGTCTDAGSGITNTSCSVAFSLGKSICAIHAGEIEGWATYTSSTNSAAQVPLIGAGEVGSGLLEGRFTEITSDGVRVVHIVIDAGSFCGAADLASSLTGNPLQFASGAARTGSFSGHVDLAYS